MHISESIKKYRKIKELTQKELAKLAGVSSTSIAMWERRETEPKIGNVEALAKALSITIEALTSGNQEAPNEQPRVVDLTDTSQFYPIQRVTYKASAGVTGYAVESSDRNLPPIYFPKSFYDKRNLKPKDLETIRVSGDSMEPSLYDDDWVIINKKSRKPQDETVFVLNYEGEIVVKRLVKQGSDWIATSDNRKYRDKVLTENCKIIGEVIHKQSERI
jgi:phage repressor protein C with HTH and peptisase S24 domain